MTKEDSYAHLCYLHAHTKLCTYKEEEEDAACLGYISSQATCIFSLLKNIQLRDDKESQFLSPNSYPRHTIATPVLTKDMAQRPTVNDMDIGFFFNICEGTTVTLHNRPVTD